ncbi:ATP-binding protein [Variovorax sp. GB1R11]|uniref:PAS domain-containing sensor histidine kinase n=1 Tax=Variovorax sp. GB1R11 TaxID=3443741 RepID=UPI003F455F48
MSHSDGSPEPGELANPDDAACALLVTDAKGLILAANRTFCTWIGRDKAELVRLTRVQDLLTVGGKIFHQTHWLPLLQLQGSVSEVKLEVKRNGGGTLPMILNAVRRERGGQIVHHLAMFIAHDRDVYERELVSSREELRVLVHEATRMQEEAKDRALFAEQMVGIVSHDLRNPLSAIHLGIVALSRGELSSNQIRILGRVSRSAERAQRLIADLLDFTAARVGKGISVVIKPADLHGVVAEAVDELSTAYPDRTIVHVRNGSEGCSVDPDRVSQMLGNLVSNAVAYGDPVREITVTSSTGNGSPASVAVHNFGPAIAADLLPTLFEPMVRGSVAGSVRSVGLGLFIVAQIAEAHGGSVRAESTAEAGTTFSITLAAPAGHHETPSGASEGDGKI